MTAKRSFRRSIALVILVTIFAFQSYTASSVKSAAFDEPIHITAGLSYVETARIVVNREHPPLLKEISGTFLRLGNVHWPSTPQATALSNGDLSFGTAVGNSILRDNSPDRVLFWARLPFIILASALAFVLYQLGRRLVGEAAALGAVLLYAFDPNTVAHSYLVTTDMGLALCVLTFLLALWSYVSKPSVARIVWAGLALGAALGAKFTAIALLPIAALLLLMAYFWPPDAHPKIPPVKHNSPCPCGSGKKYKQCHGLVGRAGRTARPIHILMRYGIALVCMFALAFGVIQLLYFFPKDPFEYWNGMRLVNANHDPNFQAYMAGTLAPRFYSYYLVAYLLKEPLASVVLTTVGLIMLLRRKTDSKLTLGFLLIPMAVLFMGYTIFSDNIGIRYILPVLPFAHLAGGVALASIAQSNSMWKRAAGALLCIWLLVAAVAIYPDHLSYFNEAACLLKDPTNIGFDGGTRCGPLWLDDSNVDWGQGLKQLKVWLDKNAPGQQVRLGYFGAGIPESYGIVHVPMNDDDLLSVQTPGLYVVSSHLVASTPAIAKRIRPDGAEWLRQTRPVAIIGHALYVFDIAR